MAVANTKSTQVTNADAAVQTLNNSALTQGVSFRAFATVETAAADDDGSVYRMVRVHSDWRIAHIWLYCDTITSGTVFDVGLYQTAANGAAVLVADCYATNVDLSTAITKLPIDAAYEARDIALAGQAVWQDGGLSANSNRYYDLCLTGDTVGSAAATITVIVEYSANV